MILFRERLASEQHQQRRASVLQTASRLVLRELPLANSLLADVVDLVKACVEMVKENGNHQKPEQTAQASCDGTRLIR